MSNQYPEVFHLSGRSSVFSLRGNCIKETESEREENSVHNIIGLEHIQSHFRTTEVTRASAYTHGHTFLRYFL